jgi:hypothetical protein
VYCGKAENLKKKWVPSGTATAPIVENSRGAKDVSACYKRKEGCRQSRSHTQRIRQPRFYRRRKKGKEQQHEQEHLKTISRRREAD